MYNLTKMLSGRSAHLHDAVMPIFFSAVIGATADIATVSGIVGHSNPNITLGIYTHEIKEATARGCDTISNLLKERMEKSAS